MTVSNNYRAPVYGDFAQFYMAGATCGAGAWDALYPDPKPGSVHNAGSAKDANAKPAEIQLGLANGVDAIPYFFILPPPVALLMWPLGGMNGVAAHCCWLLISVLAGWMAASQAGLILERCQKRTTFWSGVLTLLICCTPPMLRAVLTANLTPIISVILGYSILSLMRDESELSGGTALALGTMLKFAGLFLLPIPIAQRRWKMVGWWLAIVLTWSAVAIAIEGTQPFIEFFTRIVPTLGRSHEMNDNISLPGVLLHALHRVPPLPGALAKSISIAGLAAVALILVPMIRIGPQRMREPNAVAAAACSLLCWLLIFSPIAWSHYLMYLTPLWGWIVFSSTESKWGRAAAWTAIGLVVCSPNQMPEPSIHTWGLHLLISLFIVGLIAASTLWRLCRITQTDGLINRRNRSASRGSLFNTKARIDEDHERGKIFGTCRFTERARCEG